MKPQLLTETSVVGLQQVIEAFSESGEVHSILVLAADENGWTAEQLDPLLQSSDIQILGGIFPQIIHEGQNYTQGTVLLPLPYVLDWSVIPGLSDAAADFDTPLAGLADQWDRLSGPATHMVFVDGLSTCIATFIEAIFMNLGLEQNYLGGGAGSLSFVQKPCLITPRGLIQDAALLMRLPMFSGIGLSHGWQPISEPFKVTESHKNHVMTLDWKPAFEVYRQVVEAHSGQTFRDDNFFDIAKSYPLGISKLDAEVIMRDPLMLKEGQGMICVGEVPEGSFVRILNGTAESLIGAAAEAHQQAEKAYAQISSATPEFGCLIDCISRVLFMQTRILDEFTAVSGDYPMFGALTLGEIANSGQDYLEFYNKTAVLGLLSTSSDSVTE